MTRQGAPSARNGAPRLFHVDCKLSYTLLDDTHFLFLVHALDGMDQKVLDESLRITPALEHEVHSDAVFGHRTLRLRASTGPLTLRYRARVMVDRAPLGPGVTVSGLKLHDTPGGRVPVLQARATDVE